MGHRLGGVAEVGRATLREVATEEVTFIAASIAYHAFVSLLPILLLASMLLSVAGDAAGATEITRLTRAYLPGTAQSFVEDALSTGSDARVSAIGAVALVWGTLKVFRGLDVAFTQIYDSGKHDSLVDRFRDGFVVVLALGAAVGTLLVSGVLAPLPNFTTLDWASATTLTLLGLMVAFYPLYYVFPDVDVSPTGILPGVAFAAVGWVALKEVFGFYVQASTLSDAYGVIGGVLLLVTWLYFSALVLLTGAALNAVLAGRGGNHPGEVAARRKGAEHPQPGHAAVRDADDFERLLDRLVADAREHGVSAEEMRRALRRYAEGAEGADVPDSGEAESVD
jgi:membrane protein